jgi:prophage antirepressor-like protein
MAQVKIGEFKFGEETFKLRYVLHQNNVVKFVAKDIAIVLKYENNEKAVRNHVDDKYKIPFNQTAQNGHHASNALVKQGDPLYLHPNTVLITKEGVIQLIMRSKLPYAVELQTWLLEEVIPQVLCTGKYQPVMPPPPPPSPSASNEIVLKSILKCVKDQNQFLQSEVAQKNEQLKETQAMITKIVEYKDQQINKVMGDMNRMYTGFQDSMNRKDEMFHETLATHRAQIVKLVDKVVDLSDRAVEYPVNSNKLPVLCVAKDGKTFHAITGQKAYVERQKNKRNINDDSIVVEAKRPNPTVDWNNVVHRVQTQFDRAAVTRSSRSLSFESDENAERFSSTLKEMLEKKK